MSSIFFNVFPINTTATCSGSNPMNVPNANFQYGTDDTDNIASVSEIREKKAGCK